MSTRILASLFLACALPAQLYVVNPLGGGTHTDLQAAINAAPAGAVIQVIGGTYGPLLITRSVTILGVNSPQVRAPFSGTGQQPPAIRLQGTGNETAVFAGLNVSGQVNGSSWNYAGPGIASTGFRRLAIHDCVVRGHDWWQVTGSARSASAIVADGAALHVVRSTVAAWASDAGGQNTWSPPGAAAIAAPAATVVLLDSTVTGGDAGTSRFFWTPQTIPCPCSSWPPSWGDGGPGVVATNVFASGGAVTGGSGSLVFVGPTLTTAWGQQRSGVPFVCATLTTFATTLAQTAPLRLGAVHSIGFAPSNTLSLLLIGKPAPWPAQLIAVDLAQPIALEFVAASATSWSLPVPPTLGLLGFELAEQRFDLAASGTWLATNPLFGVVKP